MIEEPGSHLSQVYMQIAARVWEKISGNAPRPAPKITIA